MKKSCVKELFSRLMNCHDRRRIYFKKYNLVTKHCRKNNKTGPESVTFLRRKKLHSSVQNFFLADENSSQAPVAGHFVVRKKTRKQKRYLTDVTVGKISRGLFYK